MAGLGIIMSLIVGGLAGWIAEKVMKADHGLLTNIVLGIVGAMVMNFLLGLANVAALSGVLGGLIAGAVGASLLIWVYRMVKGRG